MGKQILNQENLIISCILNEAVGEQLKSQAAENGLDKGKRGTKTIPAQVVGCKRRTESIFLDMIKNMSFAKSSGKQQHIDRIIRKPNMRRRKRGPRSIQYYEKNLKK